MLHHQIPAFIIHTFENRENSFKNSKVEISA